MASESEQGKSQAPSEQLLASVLDFHLQAAAAPSEKDRKWQRALSFLCVAGAFFVAIWLVTSGPPTPKSDESASSKTAAKEVSIALAAVPSDGNASGGSSGDEAGQGGQSGQSPESSAGDEPECQPPEDDGSGDEACGDEGEGEGEATSSLNGEAPWVFAIVALLVGAFLASGQSLGFGSGAKPSDTPTPSEDDQSKQGDGEPQQPGQAPANP
jgi:hypothetical protein